MENSSRKYWNFIAIIILALVVILALGDKGAKGWVNNMPNTITISGHGEVKAVPDVASVYFTIRKEANTVKEAQSMVSEIEKKALALLKENKLEEKDIKTENASFNPRYEYRYGKVFCNEYGCPPNPGKNVLVGYEVYESISVKIRNIDDAGKIIEGLGNIGITELSGPNFTIENEDDLKIEARRQAIINAKNEAKILSKDLGVRLVKIVSFSEDGDYPMPMYKGAGMMESMDMASSAIPELPKGENTITSQVTITYEIR